jgi:hypothetical protein
MICNIAQPEVLYVFWRLWEPPVLLPELVE